MSDAIGIGIDGRPKCWWCLGSPAYEAYHDEKWGVPIRDDQDLFAKLMLDGFQAGLSWSTILNKRDNFDRAFDGWDPEKIAAYTQDDIDRLMADPGIVRNRLKVNGAVKNARAYLQLQEEEGSFSDYLWSFVGGDTIVMRPTGTGRLPRHQPGIGRHVQSPQATRLHLRRQHHLLRLHASRRHDRRPRPRLLAGGIVGSRQW